MHSLIITIIAIIIGAGISTTTYVACSATTAANMASLVQTQDFIASEKAKLEQVKSDLHENSDVVELIDAVLFDMDEWAEMQESILAQIAWDETFTTNQQ